MRRPNAFAGATALLAASFVGACGPGTPAFAERLPVLAQVDLPHAYYFREMYLPQLTSGPSSLAWSPDSQELIYSMAGSLWRQRLDEDVARQLTDGATYDYQPDWSPDGRWVVYSAYDGRSMELWVLDLQGGAARPLTTNGAVNVEPRFSPDGRRIAFVSTLHHGRFHVFAADFDGGVLAQPVRLTGEHDSGLPRYYYSRVDHEISPLWSRDGRDLIFVSNRDHIYGTGGLWRAAAAPGAAAHELHYEETNWRARPDLSPDGTRLVYSSYTGREWHNLWLLPADGGEPLPLAYGDWDQTNARWSPDGRLIGFIANRDGNTELQVLTLRGGLPRPLAPGGRRYLRPHAHLHVELRDSGGRTPAARISVSDAAGRSYAPADAWVHADDGFDRGTRRFERHYFHAQGTAELDLPAGGIEVEILHGLERRPERRVLELRADQHATLAVDLGEGRWGVPGDGRWVSADVHVHMNYGGAYRNTPAHLAAAMQAEGLGMVHALIVNKEQRFPDIAYDGKGLDPASVPDALVVHGQEFHTSYWGHLGLLGLDGGSVLPGYAGYPRTAAASLYPMNADVADIAHARGALVGYVHPFDAEPQPERRPAEPLTNELPVDVALGKVDYMEILGFSDHRATAAVWYRLLNLGFRIPAAGGTDAMANYASLRGPVGMNRVYVRVPEAAAQPAAGVQPAEWLAALKRGRTFATNGPLLGFSLDGAGIGDELHYAAAPARLRYRVRLRSIVAVDRLELVCNGRVVRSLAEHAPIDHGDFSGTLALTQSGWCLVRAATAGARDAVLDNYAYATTSPIYVSVAGRPQRSPDDARYFAAWIDRVIAATAAHPDWSDARERQGVLDRLAAAKTIYLGMQ